MPKEILLPVMGEGVIEGTLARWLVKEGDQVQAYDPIAEIETDKVTTEVMTEVSGIILELCVSEGETIPVETTLALVDQKEALADSEERKAAGDLAGNGQMRSDTPKEPASRPAKKPYTGRISPVVGRIAAEHDVDLGLVTGTGRDGRITKRDILDYVADKEETPLLESSAFPPTPPPVKETAAVVEPAVTPGRVEADPGDELIPLTNMRRVIAEHMVRSKHTSPHVTTVFEFDFSAVAAHRAAYKAQFARDGARLTYTVYIVAATVQALKQHPQANSVWTDEGIVHKREINIGMAAAVDDGLIVPVIKGADGMNLLGLARAINDLAIRARDKKLKPDEVQGGTFSITNHGTSGSLLATPIINQPQAGILGIGKIEKRVKVIDEAIAIRPLAYASFTFDHRLLDGATADAFVSSIKEIIENWRE